MIKMKKLLMGLLLMLPLCGFAQKGMQGVGGGLSFENGFHGDCECLGLSIKYQNHLTDRMRIVASLEISEVSGILDFGYYGREQVSGELVGGGVSLNYFLEDYSLKAVSRLRPYALIGFSLGEYAYTREESFYHNSHMVSSDNTMVGFGVNFGIGLDCRISHHFSIQAEFVGLISELMVTSSLFFGPSIGLTYVF